MKGIIAMASPFLPEELGKKYEGLYTCKQFNSDNYIVDNNKIGNAPDEVRRELGFDYWMRKWRRSDGRIHGHPTGTTVYVSVDKDLGPIEAFAIDSRVRLGHGVSIWEVLNTSPKEWAHATRIAAGVADCANIIPSGRVPFVPFEQ